STNLGLSWTQSGLSSSVVSNLVLDSAGTLYAATENNGIYQSSDNGSTWVSRGLVRNDIQSIAVNSAGQIFAGVYGGVFYSTDNGTGWAQKTFTPYYVYSLVCNGVNQVYCGTYNGVYESYNGGKTWTQAGLQGTLILNVSFDVHNLLLAAVQGGIFQSTQPVLGVNERRDDLPASFTLEQNFPNPFNPATKISFAVPKSSIVTLTVYDILGQSVITLVDGKQEPGEHSVNWNALNIPSGVYFYRIVTGDFVQTKKMVLMK
ncbi:MAG TPA: T9SS type A sorting domain-containing protein, partial [Bacteroidota bacterium]|nr:T9SS type A sorting domain-containing protein [Bacteroidota bacterium]